MIPRRPPPQEESVDSWLMSYADMITLLMCFFIIFVSVSEPKRDKFSEITQGLANKFGSVDMSTPFSGVFGSLQSIVESNKMFRDVAIVKTDKSIEMEIASESFFKRHTAEIDEAKLEVLGEMAAAIKTIDFLDYRIIIEGHTSDMPPKSGVYPTNWELSTARAAYLVRFLIEQGIPADRMRAVGYADTQPKVPNLDLSKNPIPENREINQRMVVKLERVL